MFKSPNTTAGHSASWTDTIMVKVKGVGGHFKLLFLQLKITLKPMQAHKKCSDSSYRLTAFGPAGAGKDSSKHFHLSLLPSLPTWTRQDWAYKRPFEKMQAAHTSWQ